MNKEKANIYDFVRMCKANIHDCATCPMWNYNCTISTMDSTNVDKANEIILKWCKEHPITTRQSEFLKIFPNAPKLKTGILRICPKLVDETFDINCCASPCLECQKFYWLAEVNENDRA